MNFFNFTMKNRTFFRKTERIFQVLALFFVVFQLENIPICSGSQQIVKRETAQNIGRPVDPQTIRVNDILKLYKLQSGRARARSYPTFTAIQETSFDCKKMSGAGYYADPEVSCQQYHRCDDQLRRTTFLCPPGTLFNQLTLICDFPYNVDCSQAINYYEYSNSRLYQDALPLLDTVGSPETMQMNGQFSSSSSAGGSQSPSPSGGAASQESTQDNNGDILTTKVGPLPNSVQSQNSAADQQPSPNGSDSTMNQSKSDKADLVAGGSQNSLQSGGGMFGVVNLAQKPTPGTSIMGSGSSSSNPIVNRSKQAAQWIVKNTAQQSNTGINPNGSPILSGGSFGSLIGGTNGNSKNKNASVPVNMQETNAVSGMGSNIGSSMQNGVSPNVQSGSSSGSGSAGSSSWGTGGSSNKASKGNSGMQMQPSGMQMQPSGAGNSGSRQMGQASRNGVVNKVTAITKSSLSQSSQNMPTQPSVDDSAEGVLFNTVGGGSDDSTGSGAVTASSISAGSAMNTAGGMMGAPSSSNIGSGVDAGDQTLSGSQGAGQLDAPGSQQGMPMENGDSTDPFAATFSSVWDAVPPGTDSMSFKAMTSPPTAIMPRISAISKNQIDQTGQQRGSAQSMGGSGLAGGSMRAQNMSSSGSSSASASVRGSGMGNSVTETAAGVKGQMAGGRGSMGMAITSAPLRIKSQTPSSSSLSSWKLPLLLSPTEASSNNIQSNAVPSAMQSRTAAASFGGQTLGGATQSGSPIRVQVVTACDRTGVVELQGDEMRDALLLSLKSSKGSSANGSATIVVNAVTDNLSNDATDAGSSTSLFSNAAWNPAPTGAGLFTTNPLVMQDSYYIFENGDKPVFIKFAKYNIVVEVRPEILKAKP